MSKDITVILPTYNRAKDLSKTLEGLANTEKDNLKVNFVIVDNGSTDNTEEIVKKFMARISLQYIFEKQNGKNRALNAAIEKADLGEIIVFTDDDVDVPNNWLISIWSVCNRWPNHAIFGGKINIVFPNNNIPKWSSNNYLSSLVFAQHHYSEHECVYDMIQVPFGPNYWVRRKVFDNNRRFDVRLGPKKDKRTLGDETDFLIKARQDGFGIVYSPAVVVGHRVKPSAFKLSTVYSRAYQSGKGKLHIYGLPKKNKMMRNLCFWWLYPLCSISWHSFRIALLICWSFNDSCVVKCAKRFSSLGLQIEALRTAKC